MSLEFTIHRLERRFASWQRPDHGLCAAMIAACLLVGGAVVTIAPWKGDRVRPVVRKLVQRPGIALRLARFHRRADPPSRTTTRAPVSAAAPRRTKTRRAATRPGEAARRAARDLLARLDRRHPLLRPESESGLLSRLDRSLASVSLAGPRTAPAGDRLVGLMIDLPAVAPRAVVRLPDARRVPVARPTARSAGPTREQIRKVVAAGSGQIRLCYEREMLSSSKPLEGRLLLRWSIDARGRVVGLAVVKDAVGSPPLAAFIMERIRTWIFPPCGSGGCVVVYPFDFYPSTVNPT